MFTKYFTCNTKQKTNREVSQDNEGAREELGAWKVEITEIIVYYSHEYAIDITDNLNKTISQEVPSPLLINRCTLVWCGIPTFYTSGEFVLCKWEGSGKIHHSPVQIWRPVYINLQFIT